jgi:ubiquinone/menaquinone biosynthesis C-methylase UbiE
MAKRRARGFRNTHHCINMIYFLCEKLKLSHDNLIIILTDGVKVMFSKSAVLYDQIYGTLKNYNQECRNIHSLLQEQHKSARSLLDVACGTGEHAYLLKSQFGYKVDGIDLDAGLLAIAKDKNSDGIFCQDDMIHFKMEKTYDAIICLFGSIGYVQTLDKVVASLQRFKEHLKDDGIIILEPWFQPGVLTPNKIYLNTAEDKDLSTARMTYIQINDRISTLHFEYLIGTSGNISHQVETHKLGLFTIDEMKASFQSAGLKVDYDPEGISGKGLYIAKKA